MGSVRRAALALSFIAALELPAAAQGETCTHDILSVDGIAVSASFCIPAGAAGPALSVSETFSAAGKTIVKTTALTAVPGALTSRAIDDVDLRPLGPKRSLHMTLAYHAKVVRLEHALALPGADPIK